jgi:hypothetical protein
MTTARFDRWLALWLGCAAWLSGCTIDEGANKARRKDCPGESDRGFCLSSSSTGDDAGLDGGIMTGEPCEQDGGQRLCYTAADQSTARQSPCKAGLQFCNGQFWGDCVDEVTPKSESCDNEDNDCDSKIDEQTSGNQCASDAGMGACAKGVTYCASGEVRCIPVVTPVEERCGQEFVEEDLDCDGIPNKDDPSLLVPCYAPTDPGDNGCVAEGSGFKCTGECRAGTKRKCGDGTCVGATYKRPEEQTGAAGPDGGTPEVRDEDCNGAYDEGLGCTAQQYACYSGPSATRDKDGNPQGACKAGTRACTDAGVSATCDGEILPKEETCAEASKGIDDDCDGVVDNIKKLNELCGNTLSANQCEATSTWRCDKGELKCLPGAKGVEVCDNKDNDCNSVPDDSCPNGGKCCGAANECFDVKTSNQHCGACGNTCPTGQACCNGTCTPLGTDAHCTSCAACPLLQGCTKDGCKLLGIGL